MQELAEMRTILFRVLDEKLGNLYSVTRSSKNVEQIREYVLVVLSLSRDYLWLHENHFGVRRMYSLQGVISTLPIGDFLSSCDIKWYSLWLESDTISAREVSNIRRSVAWIFSQILEIHCHLEGWNKQEEEGKRFMYYSRWKTIRPKRKSWGGGWNLRWGGSIGATIDAWSWVFQARHDYECDCCPWPIHTGQLYRKEVIRMGEGIEILRQHESCPEDPDDGDRWREEGDDAWDVPLSIAA